MATITKRINSKGEVTYQAKVRMKGYPVETATFARKTVSSPHFLVQI